MASSADQQLEEFLGTSQRSLTEPMVELLRDTARNGDLTCQWSSFQKLLVVRFEEVVEEFTQSARTGSRPASAAGRPAPWKRSRADEEPLDRRAKRIVQHIQQWTSPPFTLQRLCELLLAPRRYYTTSSSFCHAVSKSVYGISGGVHVLGTDLDMDALTARGPSVGGLGAAGSGLLRRVGPGRGSGGLGLGSFAGLRTAASKQGASGTRAPPAPMEVDVHVVADSKRSGTDESPFLKVMRELPASTVSSSAAALAARFDVQHGNGNSSAPDDSDDLDMFAGGGYVPEARTQAQGQERPSSNLKRKTPPGSEGAYDHDQKGNRGGAGAGAGAARGFSFAAGAISGDRAGGGRDRDPLPRQRQEQLGQKRALEQALPAHPGARRPNPPPLDMGSTDAAEDMELN